MILIVLSFEFLSKMISRSLKIPQNELFMELLFTYVNFLGNLQELDVCLNESNGVYAFKAH